MPQTKPFKYLIIIIAILILAGMPCFALYTDGVQIPHRITRYKPNRRPAAAITLNFSTALTVNVGGVPVKVDMPGGDDLKKMIRVTVNVNNPSGQVIYEYNIQSEEIRMVDAAGEKKYTRTGQAGNELDVYFTILKLIEGFERAAFDQIGVAYNAENNRLSIDKDKYFAALKIGSDYNIAAETFGDVVSVTVSKGSIATTGNYNVVSGIFASKENLYFAESYDLDLAFGGGLLVENDPYPAGVGAAGVAEDLDNAFKRAATRGISLLIGYIFSDAKVQEQSRKVLAMQYKVLQDLQNALKYPMPRPQEPDIVDISWVDREAGIIKIQGTAESVDAPDMKVYVKTASGSQAALLDPISWDGNNWEVINYTKKLIPGENKVNVIIQKSDGREVESGDATVYLGDGGKPDLILVCPRDRQVVASENIGAIETPFNIYIEGKTSPGTTILFKGLNIEVKYDGKIESAKNVSIIEGENSLPIYALGKEAISINRTIIGAYKFVLKNKPLAYVLRRGDFLFNGTSITNEGSFKGFPPLPLDPDHTGIYVGDGKLIDPIFPLIKQRLVSEWDNDSLYCATQAPKLIGEEERIKVAERVLSKNGKLYKFPIQLISRYNLPVTLAGLYSPEEDMFYCSELAFWGWDQTAAEEGFSFGIKITDLYFPMRYVGNNAANSVLPAYLCEKSMEVRRIEK